MATERPQEWRTAYAIPAAALIFGLIIVGMSLDLLIHATEERPTP